MYILKDKLFSDAGKVLAAGAARYFVTDASKKDDVTEIPLDPDTMTKRAGMLWINDIPICAARTGQGYSAYKTQFVNARYSNDDQIAIILNAGDSDEDRLRMEKMQEWRE